MNTFHATTATVADGIDVGAPPAEHPVPTVLTPTSERPVADAPTSERPVADPIATPSALTTTFASPTAAPAWEELRNLPLRSFLPRPQVTGRVSEVHKAAVPAIDVHNHLGQWLCDGDAWMAEDVDALLRTMDACGVERMVNLDGRWGQELEDNLDRYDRAHPGRFTTFCHLDWGILAHGGGASDLINGLNDVASQGARGVKVWKDLGLSVRDAEGALVLPDDPRVVAALRRAGELGLPVLIHTADPVAFFDPVDERNERLEELSQCPNWWYGDRTVFPSFTQLMTSLENLIAACPGTMFIGAHVGCHAEDLAAVGRRLAQWPNFHVDLGGRMAELGRQPRAFARLVRHHPQQVLFGSDAFPVEPEDFRRWWRFMETDDEYWAYDGDDADVPSQGRWAVSSAALDEASLQAVYRENALRLGL